MAFRGRLPERGAVGPTLVVEDVLRQLDADVTPATHELVDPGDALRGDGARTASVVAPGTTARLRITVPPRLLSASASGSPATRRATTGAPASASRWPSTAVALRSVS
jgi:hypothetical protein